METEQRFKLARYLAQQAAERRANETAPTNPKAGRRFGRVGVAALEIVLIVLFGIGLSSAALHVARPESPCAACSVSR